MPPRARKTVKDPDSAAALADAEPKPDNVDKSDNVSEQPQPTLNEDAVPDNDSFSSSAKRKRDTINDWQALMKKPKLVKKPSSSGGTAVNNLKDSLRPGLILVSIGLNPGLTTGLKGKRMNFGVVEMV